MEKMKRNGVVAKLLFLMSVYEFPLYQCNTIYLIINWFCKGNLKADTILLNISSR